MRVGRHLIAAAVSLLFLAPLILMVSGSLRKAGLPPPRGPDLVPSPLAFENYRLAFELVDLARYAANSLLVAALVVPLTIISASWAGFAIARLPRRLAAALVVISFVALMVPTTALLVPRFVLFSELGLTNTYVPLVAPALIGTSPFYVLVYAWAFKRLPTDVLDAARSEGASPLQVWARVAMPLVRPFTVAVALLAFAATWSNFLDPLVYLFDEDKFTLPLGLRLLEQVGREDIPLALAGAVFATAPVVAIFVFLQRHLPKEVLP